MESCFYEGVVHHARLRPVNHRFHYRMYMAYLDLAEVPALVRAGLLSESRFSPGSYLRRDHFGDPSQPLAGNVRDLVHAQTGIAVDGPIRLLTQLRNFGYYFSPLNLIFCYRADGYSIEAIVAEVQNTPWRERHCYVLWSGNQDRCGEAHYRHPKSFHVSPFMGMDFEYRWRIGSPGEHLRFAIDNAADDQVVFRAALRLKRVPLTRRTRFAMHCRYPAMTVRIMAAIYREAFLLWRKRCPFYRHPMHSSVPARLPHAPARDR